MAQTAPPGYDSNLSAILDLIRFGPAIWSCAQFQALLFHAERSTAYGKDADKHSEDQALTGIYSSRQLRWIRGPAGMSRACWYRANAELRIDPEDPAATPDGVLRVQNSGSGRGKVVEYSVDWPAVKRRIAEWKEGSQIETLSVQEGSQRETQKGLKLRPFPDEGFVDNKGSAPKEGSQRETHSQSPTLQSGFNSRSDSDLEAAISLELELVCAQRPRTDVPAKTILRAGRKLDLPDLAVVARFLHEKADDFRSRNYQFHPGLLAQAFTQEIIPWMRRNARWIEELRRNRELERQKASVVRQVQRPEQPLIDEQKPDPGFGRDLIDRVQQSRAIAGRKAR